MLEVLQPLLACAGPAKRMEIWVVWRYGWLRRPGLGLTARVFPCSVIVFTRHSNKDLARHRHSLCEVAHGAVLPEDEVEDSIFQGVQGLLGVTIVGGLLCAVCPWLSGTPPGSCFRTGRAQ